MYELRKAVSEQLGYELNEPEAAEALQEVANHGADSGFSGFIYYSETVKFARDNMKLIIEQLESDASDYGVDVFQMISDFNCLSDGNYQPFKIASVIYDNADEATINDGADTAILNALAWYALESIAQEHNDMNEQESPSFVSQSC
jgi:hypothetical protein